MEFELSAALLGRIWLEQGGMCFWTGLPISFEQPGARHPMRPSVDRLHTDRGYTVDNVVWASNFANRARGDLPALDFAQLMYALGFPSRLGDSRLHAHPSTEQQEE
ncbi:hypothetical protein J7E62_02735 [Variovorax paradoxus]|nr:hypothetical protein [Variovorax paradoxus]